ncbi:unnamed protein product, partial [Allacma fusca]
SEHYGPYYTNYPLIGPSYYQILSNPGLYTSKSCESYEQVMLPVFISESSLGNKSLCSCTCTSTRIQNTTLWLSGHVYFKHGLFLLESNPSHWHIIIQISPYVCHS